MSPHSIPMRLLGIAAIIALTVIVYTSIIRPWHSRWGATDEEVARKMAGDDAVDSPDMVFTRGITINATPGEIWPWILQLGDRRAGFYSYDWFDNRGKRSSEVTLPELQSVAVGDAIPISDVIEYRVWAITPNQSIVWVSQDDPISGSWTWSLYPTEDGNTRLVTRLIGRCGPGVSSLIFHWLVDAGDIVFMRKSMLGIKQRAEDSITDTYAEDVAEGVLWGSSLLQFLLALWLILRHERWLRPWLLAVTIASGFLVTFYARPPLALGVALQAGTFIALVWICKCAAHSAAPTSAAHRRSTPR